VVLLQVGRARRFADDQRGSVANPCSDRHADPGGGYCFLAEVVAAVAVVLWLAMFRNHVPPDL